MWLHGSPRQQDTIASDIRHSITSVVGSMVTMVNEVAHWKWSGGVSAWQFDVHGGGEMEAGV